MTKQGCFIIWYVKQVGFLKASWWPFLGLMATPLVQTVTEHFVTIFPACTPLSSLDSIVPAKEESDDVQLKARSKSQLGPAQSQVARLDAWQCTGSKWVNKIEVPTFTVLHLMKDIFGGKKSSIGSILCIDLSNALSFSGATRGFGCSRPRTQ